MTFFCQRPFKLGVEVVGTDIRNLAPNAIHSLKQLVTKERFVVFRDQPELSGSEQVRIGRWFGELDSDAYYKHPKSPCYDVFRVSNDESEGCRGVGRTGWHIDGTFRPKPYSYSVYYMPSVPEQGDTRFVGLSDVLEALPDEQLDRWNRLWMLTKDRGKPLLHPLVYPHPLTAKLTMCFHLGMTDGFVYNYGCDGQRTLSAKECSAVFREIHQAIVSNDEAFVYSHKWIPGDVIISDNLAVGHEASPESQLPVSQVGLRVLHRVTVAGHYRPVKHSIADCVV